MTTETMTLEQIRLTGLTALIRELGPVGMVRFLQQFETGQGDYTRDRHSWLGQPDVKTLAAAVQRHQQKD